MDSRIAKAETLTMQEMEQIADEMRCELSINPTDELRTEFAELERVIDHFKTLGY